ncbi:AAA family ATPase [Dactylosporangium cerinum]|uniref:AAA family ATPase n=1 Tax=Dactylosporangium cerinum TaxID=1434730 RepID=A0ABV9WL81_9ACTN
MNTVERDAALIMLEEFLAGAVTGRGRVVAVTGTVGAGKSELLKMFAERVVDLGALAIQASGSRAERELPLGLLNQLLRDAPLPTDERDRAMNLLYEGARSAMQSGEGVGQIDAQIVHALCTVLLELSERYPLAIIIDDVQHADRASLVCLAYLARRVRFAELLTVFSYSEFDRSAETSLHADLLRSPHGTRLRLGPLTQDGVLAMAAAQVGAAPAERFSADWFALSGGNPLLLSGLLEDHAAATAERGLPPEEVAVSDAYGRAVVTCLHRGDPRMLHIARGLAVLSEPDAVDRLIGVDPALVSQVVRSLTAAGVLSLGRFRHEVARAAVLADVDTELLMDLHRRAAVLAYDRGVGPAVVAEHLLNADGIDEPWAVAVLEDAARQALRDGRVESGVAYLKLAWRECREESHRNALMTMLLRAEWRINPAMSGNLLTQLSDSMYRGQLRGNDAIVLAKALLWHGQFAGAQEVFERLGESGAVDEQDTVTELAISRPWLRCTYPEFPDLLPRPSARPAPAVTTVSASRRLSAVSVLANVLEGGPGRDTVAAVERILRSTHLDEMTLDTVESGLLALTYAGHAEQAAPWCDLFMEEAYARRAPSRQARLAAVRAEISLRLGELSSAADHARLALRIIPASSWGVAVGGPLSVLILAGAAMGQHGEVQQCLDQPVPEVMFQTRYGLSYLQARGRFSLMTGHVSLALRDFQRCGRLMSEWALDSPGLIAWRLDVAEAYLAMGSTEQATKLIEEQLDRSTELPRVCGIAMRLFASTSLLRHRPMFLRQSGDLLQNCGDRYELARTLAALTDTYEALGESRRAGLISRRARGLAQECRAPFGIAEPEAPAEAPAPELVAVAATSPVALLSDAERRVAALAAVGYTNREISDKLFVTMSTVEQHLTRTYRKLNVTSRAELPSSLDLGRGLEA